MFRTGIQRSLLSPVSRLGSAYGSTSRAVRLRVRGVAIAYSVRVSNGGTDSFHGFEYFGLITLESQEFRVLLAFFQRACGVCAFLASSVSHGVATSPLYPTLTVYYREVRYLYWFLGLCGVSPVFSVAFALIARTIPAPVLVLALRSVADVAVFSPIPRFSR